MFHLKSKPRPPASVGRETAGQAVDSSAAITTPGSRAVGHLVELAQEADGLEVLAPAVLVGHPLAAAARVVAVEHRRDRVHAQPVGVVLAQPVEGARDEEVAHLVAAVVEDQRAPVGVGAAPRVRVLVERRAVELAERELVAREVRRDPVDDHADAALVEAVDHLAQVVGGALDRRRREVRGHLVAPRARERVRHHRQQLDVGEAHLLDVVAQLRSASSAKVSGRLPSSGLSRQEGRCTS